MVRQRGERVVEAGDPATPGTDRGTEPIDERRLVRPLGAHLGVTHGLAHILERAARRQRQAAREPLTQVGVQRVLDGAHEVVGSGDGEVVEAAPLPDVERQVDGPAQVGVLERLGLALHLAALLLAADVDVAGRFAGELFLGDDLVDLEDEHPSPLAGQEQHPEATEGLERRPQLAHRRRIVDDELVAHRHRQVHDPPQVGGGAGEDGEAAGA